MGLELLGRFTGVRTVCRDVLDFDIVAACAGEPGHLDRTDRLQPTLFTVNHLTLLAHREKEETPDFFAGHSLGEINALVASGFMTFQEGLELVVTRGRLMHVAGGGGMSAAVRIKVDVVEGLLAAHQVTTVDIANRNSPTETVLSGPAGDLAELTPAVRAAGGVLVPLKVSAPFHSRYMRQAGTRLAASLAAVTFRRGEVPVISNVTVTEYTPKRAAELLTRQVCEPVRWSECMQTLRRHGVTDVTELGPGRVLTKLWAANPLTSAPEVPGRPAPARDAPADREPAVARSRGAVAPRHVPPTRHADHRHGTAEQPGRAVIDAATTVHVPPQPPAAGMGSPAFRAEYGLRHAYVAGSMYRGISSVDLVQRMAAAGYLAFFGTGGLSADVVEDALARLARSCAGRSFGCNLLHQPDKPAMEQQVVDAALRHRVPVLEASAFTTLSAALVQYRYAGSRLTAGAPLPAHRLLAKVSRVEVARKFLQPPPTELVDALHAAGRITDEEAQVARLVPVASDICVEADSGGHTDRGSALTLVPAVLDLRDQVASTIPSSGLVRVGGAGGIGTPAAIRAVLALGADFVLTGSINQCTPQAATSTAVKDLLVTLGVHDTAMAPAADLFEVDGRVQVVRKGTLFAARANRLQRVYREHRCWRDVDVTTRAGIERQILKAGYDDVLAGVKSRYARAGSDRLRAIEDDPHAEMAAVFKTYLVRTTVAATDGRTAEASDFQIHCGPALGAFNRWVRGTALADWRHRHVDAIADALLTSVPTGPRRDTRADRAELTG